MSEANMSETKRPTDDRISRSLIGAIIAALDDRNLGAALRVLKPGGDGDAREDVPGCGGRCVTRGE
jgi:hypothetical protein